MKHFYHYYGVGSWGGIVTHVDGVCATESPITTSEAYQELKKAILKSSKEGCSQLVIRSLSELASPSNMPPNEGDHRYELDWHPGPASGGEGTAGGTSELPVWFDGDLLLLVIYRSDGSEAVTARVSADSHHVSFTNPLTGDEDLGFSDTDIAWWAVISDSIPSADFHLASKDPLTAAVESVTELYKAMVLYEGDVGCEAPPAHHAMMRKARAVIARAEIEEKTNPPT